MNKFEMPRVSTLTATLSELLEKQYDGPHISIYQAAGRLPAEAEKARIQLKIHPNTQT